MIKQIRPDFLGVGGVEAVRLGEQVVFQEREDGRAACADRVGVAASASSIGRHEFDEDRLLRQEGLDGVCPGLKDGDIANPSTCTRYLHAPPRCPLPRLSHEPSIVDDVP